MSTLQTCLIKNPTSTTHQYSNSKSFLVNKKFLPYFFSGEVVHGFGRGGHKLNCPTANLDVTAIEKLPNDFENGIYAGFARIKDYDCNEKGYVKNDLIPIVMSVGYNLQFDNQKRTMEVHILRFFENDFYGAIIEGVALYYIRPMKKYDLLEDLIKEIELDKAVSKSKMVEKLRLELQNHKFFNSNISKL